MKKYCDEVSPAVKKSINQTAKSLDLTGHTIEQDKPYTTFSRQMLMLGIGFISICVLNGISLFIFAFTKE